MNYGLKRTSWLLLGGLILWGTALAETGRFTFGLESGVAFSGSNNVRIPGEGGTPLSLTRDLKSDPGVCYRLRLDRQFGRSWALSALYAPLTLRASGTAAAPIFFYERTFPAGASLQGAYTFNSYRLTCRYDFLRTERWCLSAGFTAKIRDAAIRLETDAIASEKTNVGFVPLLHCRAEYKGPGRWGFLLEADSLAAPQGRAEDILAAILFRWSPSLTLRAGYRIVEGARITPRFTTSPSSTTPSWE